MQLVYFADPMCSWCWGFQPVMHRLLEVTGERAELRLVMGGLRAYNTEPMGEAQRETIAGYWARVNELSGQPFNPAGLHHAGFIYDTEPACRAVVTVRGLTDGVTTAHAMLDRIHRAFYLEAQDTTKAEVLADCAVDIGIERDAFLEAFDLDATREATGIDFVISQQTGITGFPTLLVGRKGAPFEVVTAGFRPAEALEAHLETLLDRLADAA